MAWSAAAGVLGMCLMAGGLLAQVVPGLRAEYHDDPALQELVEMRVDAAVDAEGWQLRPAGTQLEADGQWSARWSGEIHAASAGAWTFAVRMDGGARLFVDDQLVVDAWDGEGASALTNGSGADKKAAKKLAKAAGRVAWLDHLVVDLQEQLQSLAAGLDLALLAQQEADADLAAALADVAAVDALPAGHADKASWLASLKPVAAKAKAWAKKTGRQVKSLQSKILKLEKRLGKLGTELDEAEESLDGLLDLEPAEDLAGAVFFQGSLSLAAGWHAVRLEVRHDGGDGQLALLAAPAGTALSVVSPVDLRIVGGLQGQYFDTIQLTDLAQTRLDGSIDFTDWGAKPTGTLVTADGKYSERWTGFLGIPKAGTWSLATESNDGVRLTVNDVLVIDNWSQHAAAWDEVELSLEAGWHAVRLEHYQQDGAVVIRLLAEGPGHSLAPVGPTWLTEAPPGNQPPQVDAGSALSVVLPAESVTLSASASDPDGQIASWQWSQVSGPLSAHIADADTSTPFVSGLLIPGTYVFAVLVSDDEGAESEDEVTVTLLDVTSPGGGVSGPLVVWERVQVDFAGPTFSESGTPNPFADRRLDVTFVHADTGRTYVVPGFFAADGLAHETGATSGNVWRARFTPDLPGAWSYVASFRQGAGVAASSNPLAGQPSAFDGAGGSFVVSAADPDAPGFRGEGRLRYVGEHFLRHAGSGRPFLKAGADSPENLLAYADFDQTTPSHVYGPHVGDWNQGDPSWHGTKGRGFIGGLNYLASVGVNSVYFLTFNVAGDGDDVWPWTSKSERMRYDVSKLEQWEIAFEHMDDLGLMLHVVLQEEENDTGSVALDGGALGTQRKLYHRELVARFAHHLGVTWNLGEENTNTTAQRTAFHDHIRGLDAYDHMIVCHTFPAASAQAGAWGPLLDADVLDGASMQNDDVFQAHERTLLWRAESAAHGRPWIVTLDEFGPWNDGVRPDDMDFWHDDVRQFGLWGNLMAGGAGVEWYFGYAHPNDDLDCEDWRSRDNMWRLTQIATDFFHEHLPFDAMEPMDELIGADDGHCLARVGDTYAVYLPSGGTTTLQLTGGSHSVRWYDPRFGGDLQTGSKATVSGSGAVNLGTAPNSPGKDWVVLVRKL